MTEYKKVKEEFIPICLAYEILSKIEEPTYEQKLALEHAKKFLKLDVESAKKLMEELKGLGMRKLKPEFIVKIVDIMPEDIDELKTILAPAGVPFTREELNKILSIVSKYRK